MSNEEFARRQAEIITILDQFDLTAEARASILESHRKWCAPKEHDDEF